MKIIVYITGFLMSIADVIPGVSGGTIAFIMGYYEKLINSIKDLSNKDKRKDSIKFLINLGIGWIIGFVLAVTIIESIFHSKIYELSSLFLGLIIVSIPITFKSETESLKQYKNIIFCFLGMLLVFFVVNFSQGITGTGFETMELTPIAYVYIFVVGVFAISSMLLPGLSGSMVLMIFGLYYFIISSIKDLFKFDFTNILPVFVFGLGILIGGYLSTKIISYLFKKYKSSILYFVLGLMISSIYAIIMGPTNLGEKHLTFETLNIIYFIIGIGAILLIDRLKLYLEKKNN